MFQTNLISSGISFGSLMAEVLNPQHCHPACGALCRSVALCARSGGQRWPKAQSQCMDPCPTIHLACRARPLSTTGLECFWLKYTSVFWTVCENLEIPYHFLVKNLGRGCSAFSESSQFAFAFIEHVYLLEFKFAIRLGVWLLASISSATLPQQTKLIPPFSGMLWQITAFYLFIYVFLLHSTSLLSLNDRLLLLS